MGDGMISAAQWAQVHPPTWYKALLYAAVAVWVAAGVVLLRAESAAVQRRTYWIGFLGGGALSAAAVSFRGAAAAAGAAGLVVLAAVGYAYFFTSYLKVGDRIVTLFHRGAAGSPRSRSPAVYGGLSAPKMWWILVGVTALAAANAALGQWTWVSTVGLLMVVVMTAGVAFDDGRRRAPVAHGQYVQAVLAGVLSIPLWGAPLATYVVLYLIGRTAPAGSGRHDATTMRRRGDGGGAVSPPDSDIRGR